MNPKLVPTDPKLMRQSKTIVAFGATAVAALVSLLLHYTSAVPLGAELLGASWTAVITALLGVALRLRTQVPVLRSGRAKKGTSLNHTPTVLLLALFLAGCGGVLEAGAEKAGWCAAKCIAGCGAGWVADLLTPPTSVAAVTFAREGTAPVMDSTPAHGTRLYYHVEGPDGPVFWSGTLRGAPLPFGGDHLAGHFGEGSDPARLVLLSREPRLYCASTARMRDASVAPDGYLPGHPPRSVAEFVSRFGPLPVWE